MTAGMSPAELAAAHERAMADRFLARASHTINALGSALGTYRVTRARNDAHLGDLQRQEVAILAHRAEELLVDPMLLRLMTEPMIPRRMPSPQPEWRHRHTRPARFPVWRPPPWPPHQLFRMRAVKHDAVFSLPRDRCRCRPRSARRCWHRTAAATPTIPAKHRHRSSTARPVVTATMERPTILPYRWPGHALDVRAHLSTGIALFNAADVCGALRIALDPVDIQEYVDRVLLTHTFYPLPTTRVPGTVEADGSPAEYFTADQVRELAQDAPEPPRDEFLAWFAESFGELAGERLEQALDAALPEEPGRRQSLNVDVATAARILSRDPALEYGRDSLFAAMHSKRWIRRDAGIWVPTRIALRNGYLVRDRVRVPGQKDWYPQIRITNVGLLQLHFLVGGTNDLVLDEHTIPTLMELP